MQVGGQYPFADNVTISVSKKPAALALRIPCWADAAQVVVSSGTAAAAPLQATPCALFHVPSAALSDAADATTGAISLTINFEHSIKVLTDEWVKPSQKWQHPKGAVEIRRGPLLFTFPLPTVQNITQLNGEPQTPTLSVLVARAIIVSLCRHVRRSLQQVQGPADGDGPGDHGRSRQL